MLDITVKENGACRICGAHPCGREMSVYLPHGHVYRQDDSYYRVPDMMDGQPICYKCARDWVKLSRRLKRPADATEFVLWAFMKQTKKAKENDWKGFSEPSSDVPILAELSANIYADFLSLLMDNLGSSVKVECPHCGERCRTSPS